MEVKISVIVPVYNVELYLSKCINSILNQTFKEFELILVNDGSTDNSLEICEKYLNKDNRIKILDKNNGGVSEARNYGLNEAIGEYVCFIDSDDFVEPNYLYELYYTSCQYKSDITLCEYYIVNEKGEKDEVINLNEPHKKPTMSGKEAIKYIYTKNSTVNIVPWNKLYKLSLFDNLRYEVGKGFEDEYMIIPILWKAKKVSFVRQPLYDYFQRPGSAMHTELDLKRINDLIGFQKQRIQFFNNVGSFDLKKSAIQNYRYSIIKLMMTNNSRIDYKLKKKLQKDFRKYKFSIKDKTVIQVLENILGYIDIKMAAKVIKFTKSLER